jgi:DNA-binding response OmpR family regulator
MARILIVDDNEAYCEALRDALVADHFQVEVAPSGQRALASVRRHPPDAILLDLMIEDIDGESLALQFAQEGVTAPIIVISANTSVAATARRMKAAAWLTKPFNLPGLIDLIGTVARSPSTGV